VYSTYLGGTSDEDGFGIAVGEPANLVLLDLNASRRVSESDFRSRSANSWLLGQTLKGKVRLTIAAGRVVHES